MGEGEGEKIEIHFYLHLNGKIEEGGGTFHVAGNSLMNFNQLALMTIDLSMSSDIIWYVR